MQDAYFFNQKEVKPGQADDMCLSPDRGQNECGVTSTSCNPMPIGILIHFKKGTAKLEKFQTVHTLCLKGDGGQKIIRIPFSKKNLESCQL